ncbi:hypothetical protein BaRGS_00004251 [Batillaria attramentaria]|uniref:Secreted protein n=1 Tax=Batillaria attramentaria TaxID=370345 RepID=A0ABD0LXY0_9CAEN
MCEKHMTHTTLNKRCFALFLVSQFNRAHVLEVLADCRLDVIFLPTRQGVRWRPRGNSLATSLDTPSTPVRVSARATPFFQLSSLTGRRLSTQ